MGGWVALSNVAVLDLAINGEAHRLLVVLRLLAWQSAELLISDAELAQVWDCDESKIRRCRTQLVRAGYVTFKREGRGPSRWTFLPISPAMFDHTLARLHADTGESAHSNGRSVAVGKATDQPPPGDASHASNTMHGDEHARRLTPNAKQGRRRPRVETPEVESLADPTRQQQLACGLAMVLAEHFQQHVAAGWDSRMRPSEVAAARDLLQFLDAGVSPREILRAWDSWLVSMSSKTPQRGDEDWEIPSWKRRPWTAFVEWWLLGGMRLDAGAYTRIPFTDLFDEKRAATTARRVFRARSTATPPAEHVRIPRAALWMVGPAAAGVLAMLNYVNDEHAARPVLRCDSSRPLVSVARSIAEAARVEGAQVDAVTLLVALDELLDRGAVDAPFPDYPLDTLDDLCEVVSLSHHHLVKHEIAALHPDCQHCGRSVGLGCERQDARDGASSEPFEVAVIDAGALSCVHCASEDVAAGRDSHG